MVHEHVHMAILFYLTYTVSSSYVHHFSVLVYVNGSA